MDLLNTVTAMGGKTTLTLWIKLGLMQSSLGDALCLISSSDQNATLLLQYYEPYALIRHEDAM